MKFFTIFSLCMALAFASGLNADATPKTEKEWYEKRTEECKKELLNKIDKASRNFSTEQEKVHVELTILHEEEFKQCPNSFLGIFSQKHPECDAVKHYITKLLTNPDRNMVKKYHESRKQFYEARQVAGL